MNKTKKRVMIFAVITVFAVFLAFCFDKQLATLVSLLRNSVLDSVFLAVTFASGEIFLFFILTAVFLWHEHKRKWILPLWACLIGSAAVSFILKITVQKMRPFQIGLAELIPKLQDASYNIWNFSFPSFQSMLVFSALPILSMEFPKLKKFWIAFAVLVAFSRVYFGVHFLSDVIVGGLMGLLIGLAVVKLEKENKFGEKIYGKIFRK